MRYVSLEDIYQSKKAGGREGQHTDAAAKATKRAVRRMVNGCMLSVWKVKLLEVDVLVLVLSFPETMLTIMQAFDRPYMPTLPRYMEGLRLYIADGLMNSKSHT